MPYFAKNYKRYDLGTSQLGTNNDPTSSGLLGISRLASTALDAGVQPDAAGNKPVGVAAASGALKGAQMGAVLGPYGMAAGAVIGGAAGFIGGTKAKKAAAIAGQNAEMVRYNALRNQSRAALANDPELATGVAGAGYFAKGGYLSRNYMARTMQAEGGSLTPMNEDSVEVNGPSHEEGGVQLPGSNAEVEGGETMTGNFVFSERLGFAQEHKRLAKAMGVIESKGPMTPERVNSMKRLKEREQKLALSQEYLKHTMQHFGQPLQS